MAKINLKGMGVALVTPFKDDCSIDFNALGKLIDFQIQNSADYIVMLGTTAETPTLSDKEKKKIKEFVIQRVNRRVPLVMGLGGNNTMDIRLESPLCQTESRTPADDAVSQMWRQCINQS